MANKGLVKIDRERCKGCLLCIRACPTKSLEAETSPNVGGYYPTIQIVNNKCVACGNCYLVCPDICITVFNQEEA